MGKKWVDIGDMYAKKRRDGNWNQKKHKSYKKGKSLKIFKTKKHTTKKYSTRKKNTVGNVQNSEPIHMTFQEYMYVLSSIAIVVVFLWLLIKYGIKNIFISIISIIAIILAVIIFQAIRETMAEQKQIEYLKSLLPEIDTCKDIINNSSDPKAVKTNLDRLLIIMEEIIDTPEEILNKAGMTNSTMPQQKENVLKNYDILIKQAEETNQ